LNSELWDLSLVRIAFLRFFILGTALFFPLLLPQTGSGAVAPVGQLPLITVSVTPCPYALPILLVSELGEWKDFGIQVNLKVHATGEEQIDRIVANEWEVAVIDPFYAIKGGNEGEIAIVGLAGNYVSQFYLLFRKGTSLPALSKLGEWLKSKKVLCPVPSTEHYLLSALLAEKGREIQPLVLSKEKWGEPGEAFLAGKGDLAVLRSPQAFSATRQGFPFLAETCGGGILLPAFLVATASYADTRKTLVIRWLEGYSRGIRLVQKNSSKAATRLREFYKEVRGLEISRQLLDREIQEAFYFDEKKREEPFRRPGGRPSSVEDFAKSMAHYQSQMKILGGQKDAGEYILAQMCDQLVALRGEAESQLKKARAAIDGAEREGAQVKNFLRTWEEARVQMEEGRGCLTVIGVLSDLQRSAEQARVDTQRLREFRQIEMGIGGVLALYYVGYAIRRKKGHGLARSSEKKRSLS
jgi:ABC-type nitrate/sulfonate/bicarbonate transport system substrate-binding protein